MAKKAIAESVQRRQYSELEEQAKEYIESGNWKKFLGHIDQAKRPQYRGKARDALVDLLQLDAVGGTDSDVFKEFSKLEGTSLQLIRAQARDRAIELLKEQIENRHTYFLNVDAMAQTPYAILVKDVIDARTRELEQLEQNPSRIEVLGTFYGFSILMIQGSKPRDGDSTTPQRYGYWRWNRQRTWLDENVTETAADAVKELTGELANEVDMDKTYKTLGSSRIFRSRCTKTTADILANAVRLSMYKVPGNRSRAAHDMGRTEDSRTLPFLHHRLGIEENRNVRMSIMESLGRVGHESSIDILKEKAKITNRRYPNKEAEAATGAIGRIYSPLCRDVLVELLREGGNVVKATSISALSKQDEAGLVDLISPYLTHKSRPVVRASVIALMKLGREGQAAIKDNAPIVINRIGADRPSKIAFTKVMSIQGIGKMKPVQEFFAKRIKKYEREIRNWQRRASMGGSYSSHFWLRRERRVKQKLTDFLKVANECLQPPFDDGLLESIRSVIKFEQDPKSSIKALGGMILDRAREDSGDF